MYDDPNQMTPFFPERTDELENLTIEVVQKSSDLGGRLHPVSHQQLVEFLRITNSYYSNLIEGHNTHPIDIERALKKDYLDDPYKRLLQIESRAHIEVQKQIAPRIFHPDTQICSADFICLMHRLFYERLPNELKMVKNEETGEEIAVSPGEVRAHNVVVGRHLPPAHSALPHFLTRFNKIYNPQGLSGTQKIIAVAASHHRLLWIHPFSDGNGRVARLFSDAYLYRTLKQGYGLWSISRGLARHQEAYYSALTWGDALRQGDYDGRGNLSQKGLRDFCQFFLNICLDQISFMAKLLQLEGLEHRITGYVELRRQKMLPELSPLKSEAAFLLREALLRGEVSRGEASRITGLGERTARALLSGLVKENLLVSDTPKGKLRLNITADAAAYWFPKLFPEPDI